MDTDETFMGAELTKEIMPILASNSDRRTATSFISKIADESDLPFGSLNSNRRTALVMAYYCLTISTSKFQLTKGHQEVSDIILASTVSELKKDGLDMESADQVSAQGVINKLLRLCDSMGIIIDKAMKIASVAKLMLTIVTIVSNSNSFEEWIQGNLSGDPLLTVMAAPSNFWFIVSDNNGVRNGSVDTMLNHIDRHVKELYEIKTNHAQQDDWQSSVAYIKVVLYQNALTGYLASLEG
jgi:hypothetical protein